MRGQCVNRHPYSPPYHHLPHSSSILLTCLHSTWSLLRPESTPSQTPLPYCPCSSVSLGSVLSQGHLI